MDGDVKPGCALPFTKVPQNGQRFPQSQPNPSRRRSFQPRLRDSQPIGSCLVRRKSRKSPREPRDKMKATRTAAANSEISTNFIDLQEKSASMALA